MMFDVGRRDEGGGEGMRRWLCCELLTLEGLKGDLLSLEPETI